MRNSSWTENEQMKVVWKIVDSELMINTKPRTQERKLVINKIVSELLKDPDLSVRLNANDPDNTIRQHVLAWVGYLEDRRERPPLIR